MNENFKEDFFRSLRAALDAPDAPSKSELARRVGVSPGYISGLVKGRGDGGTEKTRRKIAGALGRSYEEMAGLPLAHIDLHNFPLPSVDLDCLQAGKGARLKMVPVVCLEAARNGYLEDVNKEMRGWAGVVGIRAGNGLVAVEMPDDSMGEVLPKRSLLVVDLEDKTVREGDFYLVAGSPPVRQVFQQENMLILSSITAAGYPPKIVEAGAKSLHGRVVRTFPPGKGCPGWSEGTKEKG